MTEQYTRNSERSLLRSRDPRQRLITRVPVESDHRRQDDVRL